MKISTVFKILIPVAALLVVGFLLFSRSIPIAIVTETERGIAVNAVPGTINVLAAVSYTHLTLPTTPYV